MTLSDMHGFVNPHLISWRILCSYRQVSDVVLGVRHGRDSISPEKYNEDHLADRVSEAVSKSSPSLKDGEFIKDESLIIISGMLVGCLTSLLLSVNIDILTLRKTWLTIYFLV